MKQISNLLLLISTVVFSCFCTSCTDEDMTNSSGFPEGGVPLNLFVGVGPATRIAELPNLAAINDPGTDGLNNIGLYVYYTNDYDRGDLSKPYIRNMECRVENGKLVPVGATGAAQDIYIYDYMTLIAFYPYNPNVPNFTESKDEEAYPITRSDYSQQEYIPYRGRADVNPTTAFYVELILYPKHTFRLEIILVSENTADFNDDSTDIKLLPAIDPADNDDTTTDGKRVAWYDYRIIQANTGGGMHVRRYVALIWQDEEMNHIIRQNEVLYENGNFTLLATEEINPKERLAYRYGYNFTTGESFIPTSSTLINDANSLQAFSGNDNHVYQVCDIDLSGKSFTPLSMINSTYDGGGHKISNLSISSDADRVGLFSQIQGSSNLKNVNLVNPVIEVNTSADTCYVGALCGRVNNRLSEQDIQDFYNSINLPENLSEVVKQALLQDMLASILNSQSQIMACRVESPTIIVNGNTPRVGTVCGINGDRQEANMFKGRVWDTYSLGGTISVNAGDTTRNIGGAVGGFCGLNEFFIGRCYTTIEAQDITAPRQVTTGTDGEGNPITEIVDRFQGFAYQGSLYTTAEDAGIESSYAMAEDTNSGVALFADAWPPGSWVTYTGIWPVNTFGWTSYDGNHYWYQVGSAGTNYPILQWERR